MKKINLILCLAMAGTLFTACGDKNENSESSVSESSVTETQAETEDLFEEVLYC